MFSSQLRFVFAIKYLHWKTKTKKQKNEMCNVISVLADFSVCMADGMALPKTKWKNNKLEFFFRFRRKEIHRSKLLAKIIIYFFFLLDSMTKSGHHDFGIMIHEVMISWRFHSLLLPLMMLRTNRYLKINTCCAIWYLIETKIHSHQRKLFKEK